jgi:two-component system sensor histidine kinase AlgZ
MADKWLDWLRSERPTRRSVGEAVVLPDFRNIGVMLRIVIIAEALRCGVLYSVTGDFMAAWRQLLDLGMFFEPSLLTVLLALFFSAYWLGTCSYRFGVAVVLGIAAASTLLWRLIYALVFQDEFWNGLTHSLMVTLFITLFILAYFNWRHRVLSPALAEARLKALQARIRPHFLFNSLNTVLGLMREDPRRAERVLENLADLFRALLAESGTLVPLEREIEHARAYAEIEMMRLGPRLTVNWQYQNAPLDALVPPLILQPLLENAVYHGIEPAEAGGTVAVILFRKDDQVHMVMRNPVQERGERRPGNRMALGNIRERLALHFDAEAEMSVFQAGGEYVVQIRMPYKRAEA